MSSKNGLCVFYVPRTLWSSRRFSCHIILWRGDFQIMLYLYQRWYNCQFKAQFSFKPCFPWPHLCCPRDINWPWVGRYQCIWKWNSNFWLLSSWNSWLQVVVENHWRSCWANTVKMAHAGKKSSTSDLQNSGKYYQFTFRPKKSNLMENLKANAFFQFVCLICKL